MSTHQARTLNIPSKVAWYKRGYASFEHVGPFTVVAKYALLIAMFIMSVGPFVWQLSTAFKSAGEDIYQFPPKLLPTHPTFANFHEVLYTIPVLNYGLHSLIVALATVVTNCLFALMAGFAISCMEFRFKKVVIGILLSTLLLPGEVTLTSQYLTVKALGLDNTLAGVWLPGAIGAMNVLLLAVACRMIPKEILDAAVIDGASIWQRIRYVVWPNVRSMVSVVALFSFIGAWDDYLWPLVVLTDTDNYTLTVGMQYLQSNFGSNPRVVAAGTIIALVPIIILFTCMQRYFFRGVEEGAVKG